MATITILERGDCHAIFLDILEEMAVNGLLLRRSVEAFDDAVGLRLDDVP